MKAEIHPEYVVARVHCTCGNEFTTHATRDEYHLEICSQCHPFYTGRQKLVDTGGRVERFQRRVAKGRLGAERASAKRARSEAETTASAPADANGAPESPPVAPEQSAAPEAASAEAQSQSADTPVEQAETANGQPEDPQGEGEAEPSA